MIHRPVLTDSEEIWNEGGTQKRDQCCAGESPRFMQLLRVANQIGPKLSSISPGASMVIRIDLADLRRFYQIDAETIALLREHKGFLFREYVAALDAFYVRHSLLAGAASPYRSDENVASSRECNQRHWHIKIEGRFDAAYEKSVEAIHNMRARIGFDPR
jgi:hypothetical protein